VALPEVETMAVLAAAGLDHRPYLRSRDRVADAVDRAVAEKVLAMRIDSEVARDTNQAARIGNNVGQIVGRALSSALENIARAMRA
jgi:hypothetical protein